MIPSGAVDRSVDRHGEFSHLSSASTFMAVSHDRVAIRTTRGTMNVSHRATIFSVLDTLSSVVPFSKAVIRSSCRACRSPCSAIRLSPSASRSWIMSTVLIKYRWPAASSPSIIGTDHWSRWCESPLDGDGWVNMIGIRSCFHDDLTSWTCSRRTCTPRPGEIC